MVKQNNTGNLKKEIFSLELFPINEKKENFQMGNSLKKMRESFTAFSSTAKIDAVLLFLSQKENIGKMFSSRAIAMAINDDAKKYGVTLSADGIDTRKLARNKCKLFTDDRHGKKGYSDDLGSLGFSSYVGFSLALGKSGSQATYSLVKVG